MFSFSRFLVLFTFSVSGASLSAQTSDTAPSGSTSEAPFWTGTAMPMDPLFFIQKNGAPAATAKLLFPADADLRLISPDEKQVYEIGKDYIWQPGSDTITLAPQTRIPFKTQAEMFPPIGAPHSFGKTVDGKTGVIFAEGPFIYNLHALASYTHSATWTGYIPPSGPSPYLSRTLAKLQAHQPLRIVLLGDSISAGASSSALIGAPPLRPNYFNRLAANLHDRFGSVITPVNLSVGGKTSLWGLAQANKVVAQKPDLVLIAFGMNDGESAEQYGITIENTVKSIRAGCPDADFILVATMTGNPDLAHFQVSRFEQYRDTLKALQGPGVAVADMTTMWIDLLKHKTFADLTGNGVNHPNDFGHAVYASVIEALF